VRVRSTDSERAHRGPARRSFALPGQALADDEEGTLFETKIRVLALEMEGGRNLLAIEGERRLDEPGDP
jgi:hypothetical protein